MSSASCTLFAGCTCEREAAAEALGDGHISAVYRDGDKHVARLRHRAGRRDGDGLAVGADRCRHACGARDGPDAKTYLVGALHADYLSGAVAGLCRAGGAKEGVGLAREDDAVTSTIETWSAAFTAISTPYLISDYLCLEGAFDRYVIRRDGKREAVVGKHRV